MNTDTKIIIGAVVGSLIIIVGGIAMFSNAKPAPKREDQGTASMSIDKKSEDFGNMKVSDEKRAMFTITNTGDSILRIWKVATSCDCTAATIKIGDTETPEFSMVGMMNSSLANWLGEVPVGQKAILTVIYRPSVMPVNGPITRQVTFSTNDPKNPDVEVSIAANVL
jgi:hypothetical protein